jgi:3-methyladenine DNA glycosylase AlkC
LEVKIAELLDDAEEARKKRKAALQKRADREHAAFLRKRDFVHNVNDLKAEMPKTVINLADVHTPHTEPRQVGRPHGKVR